MFAEDVVGALETDGGPAKHVEELRPRTTEGGVFADDAVALQRKINEAVVAQYGWLKKVSGRVCGGEMCMFRSVVVDTSDDAVVVP